MNLLCIIVDLENFKFLILEKPEINFFYLIRETQTMSVWRTKPVEKILDPKFFITSEE